MKQYHKVTSVLCGIWVVTLLYGEMFAYWVPSLWSCSWPHHHLPPSASAAINGSPSSAVDYVKVAVITDPQLTDRTSLPLPPKSLALEIVQFYTDLYMRRAFFASIQPFKPDVILFLGDYFDGGPLLSNEEQPLNYSKNLISHAVGKLKRQKKMSTLLESPPESLFRSFDLRETLDILLLIRWQESLHRFKHIFGLNDERRCGDIPVFFIPGNHDIGYASVNSHNQEVIRRYEGKFESRNFRFTAGKVEFIAVDAQTLDGHLQGNLASASWKFVKNVSEDVKKIPRVLLTHIPLYRADNTYCGPHRSSPIINQRISHSAQSQEITYQNFVTQESSKQLLDLIKPVVVLSGHDHDQCTVTHQSKYGLVTEHTVGTISWQQGNLYPSFMLLSASNRTNANLSSSEAAVMTQLCFLPMQTHIYIWYLLLFPLTIAAILFWPTSGITFGNHLSDLAASISYICMFKGGIKEKNEDEGCEYEMIWDAEGSMHLVRKLRDSPSSSTTDRSLFERGNAVMRPTVRRNISQEVEISMNTDTNSNAGYDPNINVSNRTSKSRARLVINRLLRTLRMLTVVAAVNLPLYMMLLFKDWIDQ